MRLLIVDDNLKLADWLGRLLRRESFIVDTVPDGETVLEGLDLSLYDLLIVDLGLPGVRGIEVVRQLRARNCPAADPDPDRRGRADQPGRGAECGRRRLRDQAVRAGGAGGADPGAAAATRRAGQPAAGFRAAGTGPVGAGVLAVGRDPGADPARTRGARGADPEGRHGRVEGSVVRGRLRVRRRGQPERGRGGRCTACAASSRVHPCRIATLRGFGYILRNAAP